MILPAVMGAYSRECVCKGGGFSLSRYDEPRTRFSSFPHRKAAGTTIIAVAGIRGSWKGFRLPSTAHATFSRKYLGPSTRLLFLLRGGTDR